MQIAKEEIIELLGEKTLSENLQQLRDATNARNMFKERFNIVLPESLVFHGSREEIQSFQTNVSLGGGNENKEDALVYASSEPDYAIFLALLDIQEGGSASVTCVTDEVKKSVTLGFVNGDSKIVEGYVYVLDVKDFTEHDNAEFTSDNSDLKPLFSVKVSITDLESPVIVAG